MARTAQHRIVESFTAFDDRAAALLGLAGTTIDAVHGVGGCAEYEFLYEETTNGADGQHFRPAMAVVIVSPTALHPLLTAIHEIGHALDATLLKAELHPSEPSSPRYASDFMAEDPRSGSPARILFDALNQSQRICELRWAVTEASLTEAERNSLAKLLTPREIWAYAYEQFVALRSPDGSVLAQMRAQCEISVVIEGRILYAYWQEPDFKNIDSAMERLLRSLGWM